jgi:hypothetical protein
MSKTPRSPSGADRKLADALRRLTIRFKQNGLSRRDICRDAGIEGVQLDDFTTKRPNSKTAYRTNLPNDTFLQRLLVYLLALPDTKDISANTSDPNYEDVKAIDAAFATVVRDHGVRPDPLFEHYKSKELITLESNRKTSDRLAGQFYAFRFSSSHEKLVKTYFKIHKPGRSESVLEFVNFRKEPESTTIRETEGHVLNIKENFVFFGFVKGFDRFVGVKIVVLHHGDFDYGEKGRLSGVYLSHDNDGSYDVGRMILVPTKDKFDKKNIGMVNLDQLSNNEVLALTLPKKNLSALAANLGRSLKGGDDQQIRQIVEAFKLLSSINIKFSNQTDKPA